MTWPYNLTRQDLLEQLKSSPTYLRVAAEKEAQFFGLN